MPSIEKLDKHFVNCRNLIQIKHLLKEKGKRMEKSMKIWENSPVKKRETRHICILQLNIHTH